MRRLMAAEVAAAAARGETLDEEDGETSETSEDQADAKEDDQDVTGRARLSAAAAALAASAAKPARDQHNRPLRDPELAWDENYLSDKGHEADADDTSVSSRASSRLMGESVDSVSALYESEYDNFYRGMAAGLGSDYESDFFPDDGKNADLAKGKVKEVAAKEEEESAVVRELKC